MSKNFSKIFLFFFLTFLVFSFFNEVWADIADTSSTVEPGCGDGICNGSETCSTCPTDCGSCGGGGMPSAWLMPPEAPEEGFQILINNGVEYTDTFLVNLSLVGGPDTKRMAISNFSDFRGAGQEPYASTKTWDLCKGFASCPEGKYIVYAKFYALWGTASEVVLDSIIYREKPIVERIREQILQKIAEISEEITDLRKQITQLFKKEAVAEIPKAPPEEVFPEEIPPEEIAPLVEELPPKEEIIIPPEKIAPEKPKGRPLEPLKEYGKWLWQKITNFWQKIWPF